MEPGIKDRVISLGDGLAAIPERRARRICHPTLRAPLQGRGILRKGDKGIHPLVCMVARWRV